MNSMKRQKDRTPEEPPGWKVPNMLVGKSFRKNEEAGPTWKHGSVVDVPGGEGKVQCRKEQYCRGTWDVRSTKQGKLDVVKQEMLRVNTDILGIPELKWMGMGGFDSDFNSATWS